MLPQLQLSITFEQHALVYIINIKGKANLTYCPDIKLQTILQSTQRSSGASKIKCLRTIKLGLKSQCLAVITSFKTYEMLKMCKIIYRYDL